MSNNDVMKKLAEIRQRMELEVMLPQDPEQRELLLIQARTFVAQLLIEVLRMPLPEDDDGEAV